MAQLSTLGIIARMTKQEFIEAYRVSRRWITVASFGVLAVWFCIFLSVGMTFRAWFDVHHVVAFLWIVVTLILFVTGVACVAKMVYKRLHGLVYPSCGDCDWFAVDYVEDRQMSKM